ncbi:hypothetical protein [Avibacterium paragallinarum]|uniref:hypothetical protein n=1 Tax=Avibacterium paragallinarum TaxID=728 RepID=UPI002EDB8664
MSILLFLLIFIIGLFGLAVGLGVIALPWIVSLIIAIPALFLYMLMLGSILWLAEINFFLALFALVVYCYWIYLIQKHIRMKN